MITELGKRLLRLREEAIANGMQLLSEDEVLALHQDNLDTKALELAAMRLSGAVGCPPGLDIMPCPDECSPCSGCWLTWLRQEAGEAA